MSIINAIAFVLSFILFFLTIQLNQNILQLLERHVDKMSVYPAPPPYEEIVCDGNKIKCNTCGNPCNKEHLFCFQCGQAINRSASSAPPTTPVVLQNQHAAPPPIYTQPLLGQAAPPAYRVHAHSPPKVAPAPPVVTTQPMPNNQPVYNSANDMSVRHGDRLLYDFEKISCCIGQVSGLDPKVKNNIHYEINQKGVTLEEWREWMIDLEVIQRKATSVVGCLCIFCFPGGIVQAILCAMFCPVSSDHALSWLPCCYGDWYAALRKWMDKVNGKLNGLGMHAKLLTYKPFQSAPRSKKYNHRIVGKDHNYEMSFLAIAMTPQESRKLSDESWDHGVKDGCTSGIGRSL